jgi:phosphoketolase
LVPDPQAFTVTLLARVPREELADLFRGYGCSPDFLEGDDVELMHEDNGEHAGGLRARDSGIQEKARASGKASRARWPMIVLCMIPELKALAPTGTRRMSANPHANGGLLRKALCLPDFRDYAIQVEKPGQTAAENTRPLGRFLRDIMRQNP